MPHLESRHALAVAPHAPLDARRLQRAPARTWPRHRRSKEPRSRLRPRSEIALWTQNGQTVSSSPQLRGDIVLLSFLGTHCGSTCDRDRAADPRGARRSPERRRQGPDRQRRTGARHLCLGARLPRRTTDCSAAPASCSGAQMNCARCTPPTKCTRRNRTAGGSTNTPSSSSSTATATSARSSRRRELTPEALAKDIRRLGG